MTNGNRDIVDEEQSTLEPSRLRGARLQGQLRPLGVDLGAEFVDVAVAVGVQGDVGREVQGRRGQLRRERPLGVAEVVVAVDQYPGGLVRDGRLQAGDR